MTTRAAKPRLTGGESTSLVLSFVITSMLGAGFVFSFWDGRANRFLAEARSILFVAIMGVVHLLAAYALQSQRRSKQPIPIPPIDQPALPASAQSIYSTFCGPVLFASVQHACALILSALILDGGTSLRIAVIAAFAHWISIAMIIIARRPTTPTRVDLTAVRYGYFLLLGLVGGGLG